MPIDKGYVDWSQWSWCEGLVLWFGEAPVVAISWRVFGRRGYGAGAGAVAGAVVNGIYR